MPYSRDFYNSKFRDRARKLRTNMTAAEKRIWYQFLRYFMPRVHRQRSMGNYIADFYIPKAKLIIEIDGEIHLLEKTQRYDAERTSYFNSIGIEVIRCSNNSVFTNFASVCKYIEAEVKKRTNPLF